MLLDSREHKYKPSSLTPVRLLCELISNGHILTKYLAAFGISENELADGSKTWARNMARPKRLTEMNKKTDYSLLNQQWQNGRTQVDIDTKFCCLDTQLFTARGATAWMPALLQATNTNSHNYSSLFVWNTLTHILQIFTNTKNVYYRLVAFFFTGRRTNCTTWKFFGVHKQR